ncbi:hypothetical protein AnaeK_3930 [Anaeromyxobacter sp. K]|uniref:PD-(D/E)XK motif protein n=1 Tax=Anaeromyxobacter sp. (strain K) TaxID=447217 RepID=UPI00015F885E|nr:PD-(D/E)XK motif protein [Anaeromyxobacter sp. K]ACG75138.1 hypothetical protein AnaeK_3930 [Anaeromyxobacter sp. K]
MPAARTPDQIGKAFGTVKLSPSPDTYLLERIAENLHLARSPSGEHCLVAVLSDAPVAQSVIFKGLAFYLHPAADIQVGAKRSQKAIGVVRCTESSLERNFHALVADAVNTVSVHPGRLATGRAFDDFVTEWADLFGSIRALTRDQVVGLWGELELILLLRDVDRAVEVWHGPEAGIFDFAANGLCIEVKTSVAGHRHEFSLLQVVPPSEGTDVIIASIWLRSDPAGGRTIDEQVAGVRSALTSGGLLDRKLSRLGYAPGTDSERYTCSELRFVKAGFVPQPRKIDPGVTGVRFSADISGVSSLSRADARAASLRLLKAGGRAR